ncbi:MAG: methyltransferase domain-containing protein [Gammaproteobacteria bacterium]|nr:methyltransferase domain-containing protein [Gammaproteobacteria bacterium]
MDRIIQTIDTYNKTAEEFEHRFGDLSLYRAKLEEFIAMLPPGARVLDLGCGPGNVAKLLTEKGYSVHGIDLSEKMVELARKNVPSAQFDVADVRELEGHLYDAVFCSFILPSLTHEEADTLVGKVREVLLEGGLLYLSCMSGTGSGFETTSFSPNNPIWVNYYQKSDLVGVLNKHQFSVLKSSYQDYPEPDGRITQDMFIYARAT